MPGPRDLPPHLVKKIEAYVKPFRLEKIKQALGEAGFAPLRLIQAQVTTAEPRQEIYQGTEFNVDMDARVLLMTMVEDKDVATITRIIESAASTGNPDDGNIIITDVEEIIPIDGEET